MFALCLLACEPALLRRKIYLYIPLLRVSRKVILSDPANPVARPKVHVGVPLAGKRAIIKQQRQ